MEEWITVLKDLSELDILPQNYKAELRMDMPQDTEECRMHSLLTTTKLLDMLGDMQINMRLIFTYLSMRFETGRYQEMHLFMIMLYMSAGLEPPPFFLALGQFEDLLELYMNEVMDDFRDYIAQNAELDGGAYEDD